MDNEEIEDFLAEKGFEFQNFQDIDDGEQTVSFYHNWRKGAIVVTDSEGDKKLFIEVKD